MNLVDIVFKGLTLASLHALSSMWLVNKQGRVYVHNISLLDNDGLLGQDELNWNNLVRSPFMNCEKT